MGKIKVTEQNIKSVFAMLKKTSTGMLTAQNFYPATKKRSNINPYNQTVKSNKALFNNVTIEYDYSSYRGYKGKPFIRVSNGDREMYRYRAFLIDIGDVIDFNNGREIKIRCEHPTQTNVKTIKIVRFM